MAERDVVPGSSASPASAAATTASSRRAAAAATYAAFDRPRGGRAVGRYVLLFVVAVIVLFPVYATVVGAFKPMNEILRNRLIPVPITVQTFSDAWRIGRLGRYLFNSTIVALLVTAGQVVTSVLAAYAFAILKFPGRSAIFVAYLATLLVPLEATIVTNRRTMDSLGWLNSFQGLAVPFLASAFGVFLMRQALLQIPTDLRDAALLDGVGHLRFLRHIAVPLLRPTIAALALFAFLGNWNSYIWPSLITTRQDMNTVQSGLRVLSRQGLQSPNLVMAGTVIAALPIAIALIAFQKQLVRGLTAGAVKG